MVGKVRQELGELKETIHYMRGLRDVQNKTIERLLSLHRPGTGVEDLEEEYEDSVE